jgi:hypothetical protein
MSTLTAPPSRACGSAATPQLAGDAALHAARSAAMGMPAAVVPGPANPCAASVLTLFPSPPSPTTGLFISILPPICSALRIRCIHRAASAVLQWMETPASADLVSFERPRRPSSGLVRCASHCLPLPGGVPGPAAQVLGWASVERWILPRGRRHPTRNGRPARLSAHREPVTTQASPAQPGQCKTRPRLAFGTPASACPSTPLSPDR